MVRVSKVEQSGANSYIFTIETRDKSKGYEFGSMSGARRGRAKMIKNFKSVGFKVFC